MKYLTFLGWSLLLSGQAFAGRPVFHQLTRDELIERSDFIFNGYPSPQPANAVAAKCPAETGRWQIHKVYKGDKSLEGKIISIADHRYEIFLHVKEGSKGPSYAASTFRDGSFNREASSSVLFTNRKKDGCFELAANGAQEHRFKETEVEALTADINDCEKASRGYRTRLSSLPRSCTKNEDCKIFHIGPTPDYNTPVLNLSAEAMMDDEFKSLQAKYRLACKDQLATLPAEMDDFPIRCHKQQCEKGMDIKKLPGPVVFQQGSIKSACAPHDAASRMITLKSAKGDYPVLVINWWGSKAPVKTDERGAYERGLQVTYCHARGVCPSLKSIELKLEGESSLQFNIETVDGEKVQGKAQLKKTEGERVLCG